MPPPPASGEQRPRALSLEVIARMSVMRVIVLISTPSLKVVRLHVPKIWLIFGYGVSQPGDLDL